MLADPLVLTRGYTTITANAGDNLSFPASERSNASSRYRAVDSSMNDHSLFVGHTYGKSRNRFTFRYDVSGLYPNSLAPAENVNFSQSVYCVADVPFSGPVSPTAQPNLFRYMCIGVGGLLVAVAADPTFMTRIVLGGET